MRYIFSDSEIDKIAENIVILVDNREKAINHIIEFFESHNIKYQNVKLDYGDYSYMIPKGTIEGQTRNMYFDRTIVIERKKSIDELAMNLKDDASRLRAELAHLNKFGIEYTIFVEDANFDFNIRNEESYRSNYKAKALYGKIRSLVRTYKGNLRPMHQNIIASEIHNEFKFHARDYFKNFGGFCNVDRF